MFAGLRLILEDGFPGSVGVVFVPVSSAMRERARALLSSGEVIRYIFPASGASVGVASAGFVIVVTDDSVTVLATGSLSRNKLKSVWGRYPRETRMGPVDMKLAPSFTLAGVEFEVDEEYVPVINAADAEISSPDFLPPDPLPDL